LSTVTLSSPSFLMRENLWSTGSDEFHLYLTSAPIVESGEESSTVNSISSPSSLSLTFKTSNSGVDTGSPTTRNCSNCPGHWLFIGRWRVFLGSTSSMRSVRTR